MRLWASLGLLSIFIRFSAQTHSEDVSGILGENFTFPVKINEKITEITWTKNKDKVAEWEGQSETVYLTSLVNRGFLNKENGCLTIFNLEHSDAGTYVLDFFSSGNTRKTFVLTVLDPPSEPNISCNISGNYFKLKCTADFPKTLNYMWKFGSLQNISQTQEISIPTEVVDASEKATCFIRFSQTEKYSEISLDECYSDEKGDVFHKRNRNGLIGAFVVVVVLLVAIAVLLCGRDRGNVEDGALTDNQTVNNGVNPEELSAVQNSAPTSRCASGHGIAEGDTFKEEDISLLAKHADDHGINEGDLKS
ncbi:lymphocyte function-associated antigen 3 isoform X2 [Colius striatus]|uniref:lymphocyte function-associated antigen 3 isoform X2 n=1 Tax=Colius striatus TaxID=57412 RepID=UPI002B1E0192|nr:lymphocyte function-associated antigen 3 isoform X2 [Colius striatus]